jgi:hypothetical protein
MSIGNMSTYAWPTEKSLAAVKALQLGASLLNSFDDLIASGRSLAAVQAVDPASPFPCDRG